jgi:hypothetical protein
MLQRHVNRLGIQSSYTRATRVQQIKRAEEKGMKICHYFKIMANRYCLYRNQQHFRQNKNNEFRNFIPIYFFFGINLDPGFDYFFAFF